MTSSDQIPLPQGAKGSAAARVGTVVGAGDLAVHAATSLPPSGDLTIAFGCAEFNGGITARLLAGALDGLDQWGCDRGRVTVAWVPGAFELPLVARQLARSGSVDAVVCLGAVVRGETGHYDFVAGECARGLQRVQLDTGVPVVFGVLTTDTVDQALARSLPDRTNKGRESARTAIEMIRVLRALARTPGRTREG